MYAEDFFLTLSPYLADGLKEGLRLFEKKTGIQLRKTDKEVFISRVDLMSAIIDTFDPEAYAQVKETTENDIESILSNPQERS